MSADETTATYPTASLPTGGATWIADDIVAKSAAAAAQEVEGVHELSRGRGAGWGWLRGPERRRREVEVVVSGEETSITLNVVAEDGISIPAMVDAVRARVTERVEFVTGLRVRQVDIGVVDVAPPGGGEGEAPPRRVRESPY